MLARSVGCRSIYHVDSTIAAKTQYREIYFPSLSWIAISYFQFIDMVTRKPSEKMCKTDRQMFTRNSYMIFPQITSIRDRMKRQKEVRDVRLKLQLHQISGSYLHRSTFTLDIINYLHNYVQ